MSILAYHLDQAVRHIDRARDALSKKKELDNDVLDSTMAARNAITSRNPDMEKAAEIIDTALSSFDPSAGLYDDVIEHLEKAQACVRHNPALSAAAMTLQNGQVYVALSVDPVAAAANKPIHDIVRIAGIDVISPECQTLYDVSPKGVDLSVFVLNSVREAEIFCKGRASASQADEPRIAPITGGVTLVLAQGAEGQGYSTEDMRHRGSRKAVGLSIFQPPDLAREMQRNVLQRRETLSEGDALVFANFKTGDYYYDLDLPITDWLINASEADLFLAFEDGFEGDCVDHIYRSLRDREDLKDFANHLSIFKCGYTVSVEAEDVARFLQKVRPDVFEAIDEEFDISDLIDSPRP